MKKLFMTVAFFGMMSAAQAQCENVITKEVDEFDGTANWSNKETIIISKDGKHGMSMLLVMPERTTKKTLIWVTTSTEVGCVDEGGKVDLVLRDGTRMSLYSNNDFNCKGKTTIYFGSVFGRKKDMEKLATTPIDMIRINGARTLHDEKVSTETGDYIMNVFSCFANKINE